MYAWWANTASIARRESLYGGGRCGMDGGNGKKEEGGSTRRSTHSDGHTRTIGSNTHMEQHGTPLDGRERGTGHDIDTTPETALDETDAADE